VKPPQDPAAAPLITATERSILLTLRSKSRLNTGAKAAHRGSVRFDCRQTSDYPPTTILLRNDDALSNSDGPPRQVCHDTTSAPDAPVIRPMLRSVDTERGGTMSQAMMPDGIYDQNSAYQMRGALSDAELVAHLAGELAPNRAKGMTVIADYGCAQGRVSSALIQLAIDRLRSHEPEMPIAVYHNDQLGNDWPPCSIGFATPTRTCIRRAVRSHRWSRPRRSTTP
jgi:hypothetical protein